MTNTLSIMKGFYVTLTPQEIIFCTIYKPPFSDAVKQVGKRELGDHEKYFTLDICVNDENDEDQEVPYVRYRFRD